MLHMCGCQYGGRVGLVLCSQVVSHKFCLCCEQACCHGDNRGSSVPDE